MLFAVATSALNSERESELRPLRGLPSSSQIRSAMDEETVRPVKRKRSGFEVKEELISDFVSQGLMTADQAVACFRTYALLTQRCDSMRHADREGTRFFQGCVCTARR